jgi:type IV pilus assembly protein PilZ
MADPTASAAAKAAGADSTPGDDQARPWMLSLAIRDKSSLASAYMSHIKGGGLFIPTNRTYELGDSVFILLTLMDDSQKFPITGKVAWVSPGNIQNSRPQGIGIQFPQDDEGNSVKMAIMAIIGNMMDSLKKTHTL